MKRMIVAMAALFSWLVPSGAGIAAQDEKPKFQDFDGTPLQEITILVQKLTGVRFLWTEEVGLQNKRIQFRAPKPIESGEEIFRVYESLLQVHDLMLVPVRWSGDAVPTFKIRQSQVLSKSAVPLETSAVKSQERVVTRVFELRHVSASAVHQALINMVTYPQAILPIESAGVLLVTDYGFNLQRIEKILELIDRPRPAQLVEVVALAHREAADLEPVLTALALPVVKVEPRPGFPTGPASDPPRVVADKGTNSLVIVANAAHMEMLKKVIQRLDVEKKK